MTTRGERKTISWEPPPVLPALERLRNQDWTALLRQVAERFGLPSELVAGAGDANYASTLAAETVANEPIARCP